jgi:Flp pilus assembly protein protease CpaA
MSPLTLVIFIIAIILLITGGLIETLRFLLWVAVVLFVISVIMYLLRSIGGRK